MSDAATKPIRLLGFAGSLRRASNSRAVLASLADTLTPRAAMTILDLKPIPPYDADEDGERKPESVVAFKKAIAEADGLVIVSPEYNYGMPGVLKNAIDWASRPAFNSVMKDKPTLVITNSPGILGGARAQAQIRDALLAVLARVVLGPQVTIPQVGEKLRDGRLVDEMTLKLSHEAIDRLLAEVALLRARPTGVG